MMMILILTTHLFLIFLINLLIIKSFTFSIKYKLLLKAICFVVVFFVEINFANRMKTDQSSLYNIHRIKLELKY